VTMGVKQIQLARESGTQLQENRKRLSFVYRQGGERHGPCSPQKLVEISSNYGSFFSVKPARRSCWKDSFLVERWSRKNIAPWQPADASRQIHLLSYFLSTMSLNN